MFWGDGMGGRGRGACLFSFVVWAIGNKRVACEENVDESNGRPTRYWLIIADNASDWQVSLNLGDSNSRAPAVKRKGWETFLFFFFFLILWHRPPTHMAYNVPTPQAHN